MPDQPTARDAVARAIHRTIASCETTWEDACEQFATAVLAALGIPPDTPLPLTLAAMVEFDPAWADEADALAAAEEGSDA